MKLIPLHGRHGEGKFVKVDDEDFERLSQRSYCIGHTASQPKWKSFQIVRGVRSRLYGLHDTITLAEDVLQVTNNPNKIILFKNRDYFDFRKENIEFVTLSTHRAWEHRTFAPTSIKKHSQYRGVCKTSKKNTYSFKKGKIWRGFISRRQSGIVKQYSKLFYSEKEAAKWRDEMAVKLYGEGHCYLNFPKK